MAASSATARGLGRFRAWGLTALGLVCFVYWVPLFHVVPLEASRRNADQGRFDAAAYAEALWAGPLLAATQNAVDVETLVAALQQDFAEASQRFGHRLGLGGSVFFLVSGRGRVAQVTEDSVEIAVGGLDAGSPSGRGDALPTISVETGPVFGSAVRDGSGLLEVSEFPNSQDFNAVASELNRRVEERVVPLLTAHAEVGRKVRFAGGVELGDSGPVPARLVVVPVVVQWP